MYSPREIWPFEVWRSSCLTWLRGATSAILDTLVSHQELGAPGRFGGWNGAWTSPGQCMQARKRGHCHRGALGRPPPKGPAGLCARRVWPRGRPSAHRAWAGSLTRSWHMVRVIICVCVAQCHGKAQDGRRGAVTLPNSFMGLLPSASCIPKWSGYNSYYIAAKYFGEKRR